MCVVADSGAAVEHADSGARAWLIPRPGLFELLGAARRVVQVSAPAGSGKTFLLRSWIAAEGLSERTAWVSVGRQEHDPQVFWLSVLDSLRQTGAGSERVRELTAAPDLDGANVVGRLLEDLSSLREPLWLVIDDLHELQADQASRHMELLLGTAPPELRFVLLTRHDLRLGLHRLRVEGELTEIRGEDLRFTLEESRALLKAAGVRLSDGALESLVATTEGWAAGLRLVALSLARDPDPERYAVSFSGRERAVADYLLAEVLERQSAEVRQLLLRTSLLERVSGPLADRLTGSSGSERILMELEDAGAFVVAVDPERSWFRYHHLFVDLLALELRRTAPQEVPGLHTIAAEWWAEHGYPSSFVLLIACANLANLMLVRATTRKLQTSVRSALGAPRGRLVRQALTESVVLAVIGGIVSLAFAYGGTKLILHLAFQQTYVPIHATPSAPVLAFAFGVALLTGVLFGVAPAWLTAHANPIDAMRGANRSTGQGSSITQKSLVVVQAAVSLVLLCAAGLLTQSLRNMQHQNFGFDMRNRYILHIDPQMAGYKPEQMDAFYRQLHDLLAGIPGMKSVAYSLYSPMEGDNWGTSVFFEGQTPPQPGSNENNASWVRASAGYFDTIGTKIIQGREFTDQDTSATRPIAVVNKTFAKKYFKDGNAIGRHFGLDNQKNSSTFEIVGVTEDTQYWEPTSKIRPMFFLAASQWVKYDDPDMASFENVSHTKLNAIELHTAGYVPGLESQVRHAIAQVNPDLTVIDFRTFSEQVENNFNQQGMIAQLTSLFGLLALVLASIGLYGVTAYSVERRTSEIGIRMALGADRTAVLKLVLAGAFLQVVIGLAIGIPATILGGRAVANQLYGVKPYDPLVLIITTLVLLAAAFVAAVLPARRAANTEPMHALRTE